MQRATLAARPRAGHPRPAGPAREPFGAAFLLAAAAERFGGIDILANNASAISLTPTPATPMKRFDLMFGVNGRGTYLCTATALPYLTAAAKAGLNPTGGSAT